MNSTNHKVHLRHPKKAERTWCGVGAGVYHQPVLTSERGRVDCWRCLKFADLLALKPPKPPKPPKPLPMGRAK